MVDLLAQPDETLGEQARFSGLPIVKHPDVEIQERSPYSAVC